MAEVAVTLLVEHLLKLLHEEASTLSGVDQEVKAIISQLKVIKPFIKHEGENVNRESVKSWLKELREVAFDMEDVVDHYLLKVAERRQREGVFRVVTKMNEKRKTLKPRHEIASEINRIKTALENLYKQKAYLGLVDTSTGESVATPRLEAHFVEESQLVGIETDKRELIGWLTERQRPVMVVVGPAGIGKTTIVKNVYVSQETKTKNKKGNFEFCAWITLSRPQDDDANMLIWRIINKIREEDPSAPSLGSEATNPALEDLISNVGKYFMDKRCLIVFDDAKLKLWNVIKHVIRSSGSQSGTKVIFITRDENVAEYIGSDILVKLYKQNPLSSEDALKLFYQKAFQFEQVQFPELTDLSKEFVKKCNGVPKAIVDIAGLLSTKKTAIEWRKVLNQLGSLLQSNPHLENVQQMMLESYKDLPSHLKACFLYFGLFPEGYSISCMRLIRLWVAEGFVEGDTENTSMEETANEYLVELVRKCLVHVSRVDFDGRPKSCHVYDLMHGLIANICKEQMSYEVMKDRITPPDHFKTTRRLSIMMKKNDNARMRESRTEKWGKVRSCFVFDDAEKWLVTNQFFSSFELLIGLDLSNALLDGDLPKEVGELLNLKYLSLRNTNIKSLPKSIGNLENLQTLDLKETRVHELPEGIQNLTKLRHLLAYYIKNHYSNLEDLQGVKLNKGLKNLESLQKLSFLDVGDASISIIEELKQLSKLRKLGITNLREMYGETLCQAIENMTRLCSLSIGAMGNDGMLQLQHSFKNPPSFLQRLYLYGRLKGLPNWIQNLPNLTTLYLRWSNLKEDPLPLLKGLSKLLHLEFCDTYRGDTLHFMNGSLKSLKVLHLASMPRLKTIKIDEGAIPDLAKLKIGKCHEMVQVPRDLLKLKFLQKLYFYDMHDQFMKRMCDPLSEDRKITDIIPLVDCSNNDHFFSLDDS
ncbi:disease resistance protein RPM1 [Cajanus cajan]|uniref:Disease resistance protein RPM1 n=1 Tax=Cajanus cajan TaxID=3821 RepID=A0A151RFE9_CAJCA|nr:disease resistance protein RPM1 [Cajanus cajan]KYP41348.1 Disease resistance protein RPM1 [Cajanus cajan]